MVSGTSWVVSHCCSEKHDTFADKQTALVDENKRIAPDTDRTVAARTGNYHSLRPSHGTGPFASSGGRICILDGLSPARASLLHY